MTRLERVSIWLAFGMLAASATLAFWTTGAQIENARWVEHTLQVMETLDVASGHVTTMQNSRRGFALTGDEDELLSFTSATTGLGSAATRLRSLTSDNPIQQVRLDRLDPLLARAEQLETESIASRRADGFVPDREAASARNVSGVVRAVTALLAELTGEERVLLVRREQSMATSVRIARIAHVAGTAVGLVVILLAFLGLRRGNERLVQSELAARQGEQDLYTTLNSIGDGVISTNATGHVVRINRVAEALTGWGQAALGKPLAEVFRVIDGSTRLVCEGPFDEVLRLNSAFTWSNHKLLLPKQGEPHPVADSAAPIRDAAGKITGVVLVFHDVTKERAAEVILRESEAALRESAGRKKADDRFRALVESGPDAMVIFDDGGQIVLVNAPAEALFGYRRDELLGRGIDMLVPKGDSTPDLRSEPGYFSGLNAQMSASRVERCGKRKDGTELPIEITMSRLATDDGPLVASAIRDISVRKEVEAQLRASDERFRVLVGTVKDYAIFMLDPTGHVTSSWNEGAERIKGYTSAEIVGQYFSKFYLPEDVESGRPERDLRIAESTARFEDEGWRIRKDGSRFMAIVVLTAVRGPTGELLGFSKVTRDMTERYEAENAQKLLNRELEAFSYSVAHDLRAPLRGMNGFAQVLVDKYGTQLDAQGQDWLQEILLNAKKMGELIDALLSLARLARSELHAERVDLTAVAHEVAAQLAAESPRVVEVVIADGLVAEVDRALALTIFANLLGNAFKFTQNTAAPRVEVGTVEHEGAPAFFVRDNGAGFDMAFAGKLFTPFHRLHTVREFPGTGIGLATVQRIVHRHGGQIWAEGRVDGGATFYFTLPGRLSEA